MQTDILLQILYQSKNDCSRILKNINSENLKLRLNEQTASVGFIYRHIGEATNLIAQFFGYKTEVEGNTMGQKDTGLNYKLEISNALFIQGYDALEKLVKETPEQEWLEEIDTTWFGRLSKIKLLSIIMLHNAQHCGQIASAIAKGQKF